LLPQLVHFVLGFLAEVVRAFPGLLKDPLDALPERVQLRRLGVADLALVDGDAPVQLPELPHRRRQLALGFRGPMNRPRPSAVADR